MRQHGYPVERHRVLTADGYLLTAFRIPHGRAQATARGPVLLQHALLCSSFEWVNNAPQQSLGFLLADEGFDVWLGNNRGNAYGLNHTSLPVDSEAFWDFSWDEMALHDLPASVEYILRVTGAPSLSYVGHSEGTIQAFAGFSRNAELSAKVDLFVALAPVAYVYHQTSPVFSAFAELGVDGLFQRLGQREFLPVDSLLNRISPRLCSWLPEGCDAAIFLFCGATRHINATRLPVYLARTPAGTSVKNMAHWAQQVRHDGFRMYDYGSERKNRERYNRSSPPRYELGRVTVKTALFTGGHDILADPTDVGRLVAALPPGTVVHQQQTEGYAHLDFAWGQDANTIVYARAIELLKAHSRQPAREALIV